MAYSSSLSDQEWEIIKPLLPKKKKELVHQSGLKDKFGMVSFINSKIAVMGLIYQRIYLLILPFIGIIKTGKKKVSLKQ